MPPVKKRAKAMPQDPTSSLTKGLARLKTPVLPLVHIIQWLFLSGPFQTIAEMLPQLSEPIEMEHGTYPDPASLLTEHGEALAHLQCLKRQSGTIAQVLLDENGARLDAMESVSHWTRHLIINRELETINSLLCGPQGCTLCCTGPAEEQEQFFFEIPLDDEETSLFDLPRHDGGDTRAATPYDESPLLRQGRPFYAVEAALYNWRKGWSLILPKGSRCPQLDANGGCKQYLRRPSVCRKPQIFSYLLERNLDLTEDGKEVYTLRNKILAIWDCPYVRDYKEEIATYAELCGLEPVFRKNKE